jgi:hypothetical protein
MPLDEADLMQPGASPARPLTEGAFGPVGVGERQYREIQAHRGSFPPLFRASLSEVLQVNQSLGPGAVSRLLLVICISFSLVVGG